VSASNYIVALPALIAARRVGIPFAYDIRGFWEITRLSRESGYETSPTFKVQSLMEAKVANQADIVFTLTEAMREELIGRGVESEKIQLMPNACNPERFIAMDRDDELAARLGIPPDSAVIGYIGTFVDYEGLEDLAMACGLLKNKGINFRLLLVGNENTSGNERGPISQAVLDAAENAGFSDWLIMPGRVPHEDVEKYYSLIDIAPFPRKPWPVCEMVSPMKPLEAFAMEKAVVVSSVRALQEMVKHEETGLVFEKGNVESLADVLERLVADPALRQTLGKNGRRWVHKERTWAASTDILASYVRELSDSSMKMRQRQ
jgi:glycosyltransferase involved in cell wall biosynthesis